jgi:YbaB/EbfC DNA-binding family protein
MSGGLADSVIARIIKQRDLMTAMHEQCKSISARVTSRDKTVSVEVDGLGAMTGLWLGENAYRNGADALARRIVDTADAAAKVALARQNFLTKEFNERLASLQQAPLTRRDGSVFQPNAPAE